MIQKNIIKQKSIKIEIKKIVKNYREVKSQLINLLSSLNIYKTYYKSFKRNNTFNELINSDNRFNISSNNNKSRINFLNLNLFLREQKNRAIRGRF